jgi:hypothetical protein
MLTAGVPESEDVQFALHGTVIDEVAEPANEQPTDIGQART